MNFCAALAQTIPSAGTFGMVAGIVFFLIFIAIAYVAFRILKRTVKTGIRIVIVLIILVVAVIGSASLFWLETGSTKPRPSPARSR
jgi:apolipoprotein N-acyltransferase